MRVAGGRFRGRSLVTPEGSLTRPTSGRVRQSLFDILEHGITDFDLGGARVLDLFAGSGAFGVEALSRGASYCLFVEDAAAARGAIRTNIETLELTGITKLWRRDATRLGPAANIAPFQVVFADPPYGNALGDKALSAAAGGGWLSNGAVCVLEEDASINIALPPAFETIGTRTYGGTALFFFRFADAPERIP